MKPSRSGPSYSAPGIRNVQFGVTRVKGIPASVAPGLARLRRLLEDDVLSSLSCQAIARRQPRLTAADDRGFDAFHGIFSFLRGTTPVAADRVAGGDRRRP